MKNLISSLFLSIFLVACGGGGGGGGEDLSTVSEENVDEIAVVATEVSEQIVNGNALDAVPLPVAVTVDQVSWLDLVIDQALDAANNKARFPELVPIGVIVSETEEGLCGGSFTFTFDDEAFATQNGSEEFNFEFEDFCLDEGLYRFVYDGEMEFTFVYSAGEITAYTLDYDLSIMVTFEGETEVFSESGSVSCTAFGGQETCTYSLDEAEYASFNGDDTYTVRDTTLSGNNETGYDYTSTVTSSEYGTYEIIGTDLILAANGNFESGSLEVIDSSGIVVILIVFVSSSEYEVTYDGETNTYPQ